MTGWLADNQHPDVASSMIHGDFRLDNVVLGDDLRPRAVLDWELATVGDPLMDLGSSLAYWVQADDHPMMLATKRSRRICRACSLAARSSNTTASERVCR